MATVIEDKMALGDLADEARTPQDQQYIDQLHQEIKDKEMEAAKDAAHATVPRLVEINGQIATPEEAKEARENGDPIGQTYKGGRR